MVRLGPRAISVQSKISPIRGISETMVPIGSAKCLAQNSGPSSLAGTFTYNLPLHREPIDSNISKLLKKGDLTAILSDPELKRSLFSGEYLFDQYGPAPLSYILMNPKLLEQAIPDPDLKKRLVSNIARELTQVKLLGLLADAEVLKLIFTDSDLTKALFEAIDSFELAIDSTVLNDSFVNALLANDRAKHEFIRFSCKYRYKL
jgi:hypothetical protein